MISEFLPALSERVLHRAWVISDLQQASPVRARECLTAAVEDFGSLGLACEQIWYLGDGVEGTRVELLEETSAMQVSMLGRLGVPVKYVLGNHDFDHLLESHGASGRTAVLWDVARRTPGWRTTDSIESFYFWDRVGPFILLFLSDHADPRGRWIATHGRVHGDASLYPYGRAAYERLRDEMAAVPGPVITCSHYAFPGGNRPSALQEQLFPLPSNVRLHLYGHAHIGDALWAKKDRFRKMACVDDHPVVQVDVASLENDRGNATRSAILQIYNDLSLGVFFRNHSTRKWEEMLLLDSNGTGHPVLKA